MPLIKSDYIPNWWLRHGHLNTLYTYFYRTQQKPTYKRERWETLDDDFIDLDFVRGNNQKLAILSHGLEGGSYSQYIMSISNLLSLEGYDICALNYRSCSGEMNRTMTMYHSGFTMDLNMVVNKLAKDYEEIHLIGYSLGGNMNLKYTTDGEYPLHSKIKSVVSVSAPIDLAGSSKRISSWYNYQYQYNFLQSLNAKMRLKATIHPECIDMNDIKKVKTLIDFDEYFTGPLHGFDGAQDYYRNCNALQFLEAVTLPTLLISSEDDPFLTKGCIPKKIAEFSKDIHLIATKYGGHVGFTTISSDYNWLDYKILEFIRSFDMKN